jgi:hypothetical protein
MLLYMEWRFDTMRKLMLLPLLLLVITLPMCSSSGGDATSPTPAGESGQSTLRVYLTDKPAEEYLAVNVTVVAVRIHQSSDVGELDAGWIELPVTAAMPIDLLTLRNGVLYELCQTPLPAGHYQQIRLELASNTGTAPPFSQSVVTADGVTHALEVPSGTIKIVHGVSVDAAQVTSLTLDFDASQSVKQRGNGTYYMTPVIKAD